MIQIEYSKQFLKSARQLPKLRQVKLADLLSILRENPFGNQLHTKKLTGDLVGFYSFRITREWRVIFQFINPEGIKLLRIGHRKDIYKQ